MQDAHDIVMRNIDFWLKVRGMTRAALSRKLDLTQSAISQWFARVASPELRTIGQVARHLSIPVAWLFLETDDERQKAATSLGIPVPQLSDAERFIRYIADKLDMEVGRIRPKKRTSNG